MGRPMRRGYTQYPGDESRYGRQNVSNDGGAPEALRGWSSGVHFPKVGGADKNSRGASRDFMALNRCAVQVNDLEKCRGKTRELIVKEFV